MTRIIISGGGTGGHVFPAIAIANAIKLREPGSEILFIGAKGRLEMEKVPAAGYRIEGLNIRGLQRRLTLKNLSFPFKVISSMIRAKQVIRKFKPDVVVGVGGYASGPTLKAAARNKIPTVIQEQNSYPGITNKLLAKKADKICVAYEGMERFFRKEKVIITGNPVRQDILALDGKKGKALQHFSLKEGKITILVLGGSLGSGTINRSIQQCIEEKITDHGVQLLWQTGKHYFESITANPATGKAPDVHVLGFIDRMDLAYAAADIVISRAGAIAISELCIAGRPVILIPSPNVAEDHQTKNAEALVKKQAAILLKDSEAVVTLYGLVTNLIADKDLQSKLSKNIAGMAIPDAADRIAAETLSLVKNIDTHH
jgi:UDP-N-acetylglucosamine--N-acetylmuramyl-(pentapeptide) pyrophosphoryl-undecaprenol N-acetylglucosamine transferase